MFSYNVVGWMVPSFRNGFNSLSFLNGAHVCVLQAFLVHQIKGERKREVIAQVLSALYLYSIYRIR